MCLDWAYWASKRRAGRRQKRLERKSRLAGQQAVELGGGCGLESRLARRIVDFDSRSSVDEGRDVLSTLGAEAVLALGTVLGSKGTVRKGLDKTSASRCVEHRAARRTQNGDLRPGAPQMLI